VTDGATFTPSGSKNPEIASFSLVKEDLQLRVDPYIVTGIPTTYTLVAEIEEVDTSVDVDIDTLPDVQDACPTAAGPLNSDGCPDTDRDTVVDKVDRCPQVAGAGLNGCPVQGGESIVLPVDGKQVRSMFVDTRRGRYDFAFLRRISGGRHTVKVVWYAGGEKVGSVTQQVRR